MEAFLFAWKSQWGSLFSAGRSHRRLNLHPTLSAPPYLLLLARLLWAAAHDFQAHPPDPPAQPLYPPPRTALYLATLQAPPV
jgi:hypothetical protein